jgi:hypothetical protein
MPIFMTPLLGWTLGVLGATVVAKLVAKEWRRVNEDMQARDSLREAPARERIPGLRRDPMSGIYRPE